MSATEIQDFSKKARILIEARRRMTSGEQPTKKLYEDYLRIPQHEIPLIYEQIDYWGMTSEAAEAVYRAPHGHRTWADVVKYGKQ